MRFFLPDATATTEFGVLLGRKLLASSTLLLEGDLGSGKTTLTQGIAQGLGIVDAVVSPTFTLVCEYSEGRLPLYHFDLYRLTTADVARLLPELYWEGVEFEPGLVVIEWPDRLPYRPAAYWDLQLTPTQDTEGRLLVLTPVGQDAETVTELQTQLAAQFTVMPEAAES
ncbi:tRNA (adenosine(37)-N6)-threonylcarbamoyltransferase complex ATPase subunit type 1 TsaE [Synechococcus elongatus]|uniref:tRNA threonylcarbamoyladenosine biosynthesis protein TsaE n=1 Tax=Synechococcus elongatus PCC 11802 TaxID=2283154 RepID=A0AAT9JZU5_SYNEL|nr:tRNA (adenosine(37)-N6)-threonylcarbamoyltransferase complex ATPase subunit type 1 TsaE [Synechococcus elongatus]QFZ91031.1 tRNA (adenosine(37)-N6)-threonylcarbamoyltransferase complex ATPase subunit type 1 TsaE [Synechococcus elongatus PCC 11802]